MAAKLKQSGLNIVYLQFDSFHDEFYQKIRGQKLLAAKLRAIEVCRKLDMEIILVNTLMRGFNDKEVGAVVRFAAQNSDIITRINLPANRFHGTEQPIIHSGKHGEIGVLRRKWKTKVEARSPPQDFFPMSVMVSPIMIMRKFMKKPWPLFSCSPQCGIVNWMYVSKNQKIIPINHFVDFEKFFSGIQKTAQSVESKGKLALLSALFVAAMRSLNWPLVTKEIGFFNLMKTILKMHVYPSYQSLGNLRRRIFLLGCMAFMDQYTFDVNRVKRCVIHYATPDLKIIPFCAYNNIHRITTEKEYALKGQNTAKAPI